MLVKFLKSILYYLPLRKIILFESCPDYSDNTKAVFDEMVSRGVNKKYKLVWLTSTKSSAFKNNRVKSVYISSRKAKYYVYRSKCIICCNAFITTDNPRQFRIYLGHGNPLKNTKGYYEIPSSFKFILSSSESMKNLRNSFYGISKERMFALGYPRNDVLTKSTIDLHPLFRQRFDKIIVWYPTVRQFRSGNKTASPHALPVIWDNRMALELNECANKNNVLIVLKPHFAQDTSMFDKNNLSNIVFIDDSFFRLNNLTSYQFVGSCDALLTDFSSIYYDYTLCDKPIGLIWEDYNEYEKNPGFAVDMNYAMKGGVKIYNLNDFKNFISDVANGVDALADERREIREFANYSTDGCNSQRVVDFILEKAKIKI